MQKRLAPKSLCERIAKISNIPSASITAAICYDDLVCFYVPVDVFTQYKQAVLRGTIQKCPYVGMLHVKITLEEILSAEYVNARIRAIEAEID